MNAVVLDRPDGLVELPLDLDVGRRRAAADQLAERLAEVTGGGAQEFASLAVAAGDDLARQGVRLLGQFVVEAVDGLALGTLVVGAGTLEPPEQVGDAFGEQAIEALAAQTAERRPYVDARRIDLPCGPAVASLVFGEYRLPPEETGAAEETVVPTFRAEFLVPTPTWDHIVVLDVSTSSEAGWPTVSTTAVAVARSLRFVDNPADAIGRVLRL